MEPFELFALRYAHNGGRTGADNFVGGTDLHESSSPLDYYIWVARRSDRCFVIDTGFQKAAAEARGRDLLRTPAEALALLGIDAGRVDEVLLSHAHFDHAGGLGDFPAARVHVQDAEMAYATGRCMCHGFLQHPFDVEDVVRLVRLTYAGRVCHHDGDREIVPGLSVHRIGGHSAGLQSVRVWTKRGWVVVASDAAHLYENFRSERVFPFVYRVDELLEGYRRIRALADSDDHVVPGHDPLVMQLYPPVSPELEGLAVRLDEPPSATPRGVTVR
ncbi:N-acyl homoserine lactonase family protein [Pseudoroseicyclus sp. CXY001]|uniref:N-acyl homoserine lactonase family protein n=1 Tax=Pseudoroseicyclus sp. CXY001 TaxID=3242492 RepID=UPI00358DBB51